LRWIKVLLISCWGDVPGSVSSPVEHNTLNTNSREGKKDISLIEPVHLEEEGKKDTAIL